MRELRLHPPAKLNRFLHILGRRPDGFHELQTAFELIDWCDELHLRLRSDGRVERIGGPVDVPADSDLIVRAAQALRPFAAAGCGVDLNLTKHIPLGAGLGGGSSDAAASLLGLNLLWDLRLPLSQLLEIGLRLGADVPVFLAQQPAFAAGVGERLLPLPLVARDYVVVFPGVALATARMFADAQLRRDCAPISVKQYLSGAATENVFEAVAVRVAPAIAQARDWLQAHFGQARLTGSGSALFAQIDDRERAQALLAQAPTAWRCRCVRSIANWFDKPLD